MELTLDRPRELSKKENIVSWVFQVLVAVIFLQTLFFKFSGAAESVYIFSALGVEPWGRIATGIAEFGAAILLLIPRTSALGALFSLGIISGAILSHLTVLGIALPDIGDRGELFGMAVVVFIGSAIVLFIRRKALPILGAKL